MPNPKSLNNTNCDYLQPTQDYHQLNWRRCFFLNTFKVTICSKRKHYVKYFLFFYVKLFVLPSYLGFHWLGTCTLYNNNEDESNLIDAFWLRVKKITWSGNVLPSPVMRSRCWVPCLTEGERVRSTKAFTPNLSTRLNQKLYCGCTGSAGNRSVGNSSESLVICSFTLWQPMCNNIFTGGREEDCLEY